MTSSGVVGSIGATPVRAKNVLIIGVDHVTVNGFKYHYRVANVSHVDQHHLQFVGVKIVKTGIRSVGREGGG